MAFNVRSIMHSVLMLVSLVSYWSGQEVIAQNSKGNFLTGSRADEVWDLMAHSPYAQAGEHGMVVYMISYSSCGNCIVFLRDFWEAHKANMQLREIFAPVNEPRYIDEAADIALTRSAASAEAYYKRLRVAPPVNSSPDRQAALKRDEAFTTLLNGILRQIGHVQDSFPTFIFRVKDASSDKVMIVSGWGDPQLTRDMDRWVKETAR